MSIRLNSNIASLKAQRRLSDITGEVSTVLERLSSGQRINRAADDAAGLAISESLLKDARVFNQGIRNLNDGISALNIADGALEQLSGITVRLKELATQAANGSFTLKQRKSLDREAQALSDEYFRIAKSTTFNGRALFESGYGELRLQAGYGTEGGISQGLGGEIGTGTFGAATSFDLLNVNEVTSADFNGDGILDIAGINGNEDVLSILIGNGSGGFSATQNYSVTTNGAFIGTGDFNNDGILDMAVESFTAGGLGIMLGTGGGAFGAAQYTTAFGSGDVEIADFNSDGALDLALGASDGTTSIFIGNGNGTFRTAVTYAMSDAESLISGDFNNDGIADIASVGDDDDAVFVRLGIGDGTFGARTSYGTGEVDQPEDIKVADMNNDGNLDFVVTSKGTDATIGVMLGQGNGTFGAAATYANGGSIRTVELGDFNGDGFVDMATTNSTTGGLSVRLNTGAGTFGALAGYTTTATPFHVFSGDFNGDGVLDLGTSSSGADKVGIILGNTADGVAPLLDFKLTTQADARQSLGMFDRKIAQLAQQRGEIGAFQSRIGSALNTLHASAINVKAAAGRIRDADTAEEASRLVRVGILQSAASAVLAQANQQPALALRLLSQ